MNTRKQRCLSCRKEWDAPDQRLLKGQCYACDRVNTIFVVVFTIGLAALFVALYAFRTKPILWY